MGRIETALIRHYLKPTVTSDLPGRLRLSFKGYQMLPKEALPYLHYVQDVMTMLPGVQGAQVNPRIGTALVKSDANRTNRWIRGWNWRRRLTGRRAMWGRKNWRRWHAAASRFAWDR